MEDGRSAGRPILRDRRCRPAPGPLWTPPRPGPFLRRRRTPGQPRVRAGPRTAALSRGGFAGAGAADSTLCSYIYIERERDSPSLERERDPSRSAADSTLRAASNRMRRFRV